MNVIDKSVLKYLNNLNIEIYKDGVIVTDFESEVRLNDTSHKVVLKAPNGYYFNNSYYKKSNDINVKNSLPTDYTLTLFGNSSNYATYLSFEINLIQGILPVKAYGFTDSELSDLIRNKGVKLYKNNEYQNKGFTVYTGDVIEFKTDVEYNTISNVSIDYVKVEISDGVYKYVPHGTFKNVSVEVNYNPPRIEVTQDLLDFLKLNFLTLYIGSVAAELGNKAYSADDVTLICSNGYSFSGNPIANFVDRNSPVINKGRLVFSLETDQKANLSLNVIRNNSIYYSNVLKNIDVFVKQNTVINGVNAIFKVDNAIIRNINNTRYVPNGENSYLDFGSNIIGLINLPFIVSDDELKDGENILLGKLDTTVSAKKFNDDKYIYDFGKISISGFKNSLDYNVKYILHLPYADSLEIDPSYVENSYLNVKYVIDLYTGKTNILVYSGKTELPFIVKTTDIGISIPYSAYNGISVNTSNKNINMGGFNEILIPTLEVVKYQSNLNSLDAVIDDNDIKNYTGYCEVNKIDLKMNDLGAMSDIVSLLKNGVFIK